MNDLVQSKIRESKKSSSGVTVPLKEGLQAVLGRPNEDGMVEKVLSPLRLELESHDAWEKTLQALTKEAIDALRNNKNFKPDVQVTYAIFLENLISEMKPLATKDGFEKKLVERIRDAKIQISAEAQRERKLRLMKSPVSPSEMAELALSLPNAETKSEASEKAEGGGATVDAAKSATPSSSKTDEKTEKTEDK